MRCGVSSVLAPAAALPMEGLPSLVLLPEPWASVWGVPPAWAPQPLLCLVLQHSTTAGSTLLPSPHAVLMQTLVLPEHQ